MRQYSYPQAWFLSAFSKDLYRDVARNWRGAAFWYLLLLIAIVWGLVSVRLHVGIRGFAREEFPQLVQEVPEINIRDGRASVNVEQPYFLRDPETQQPFLVIDTTGEINTLAETEGAVILLTETELHIAQQRESGQVRIIPLKEIGDLTIDQAMLQLWMDRVASAAGLVIFVVGLIVWLFLAYVLVLLGAAIGAAISSSFRTQLSYGQLVRLTAVAATPAFLLYGLLWLLFLPIPCCISWIVMIATTLALLAMGIRANADAPPPGMYGHTPYFPPQAPYGPTAPPYGPTPPTTPPPPPTDPLGR